MKIFVTGGTGFIGRHFIQLAVAAGHDVQALRRTARDSASKGVTWIEGTLASDHRVALSSCEALVHFAAAGVSPQPASWDQAFATNVTASLRLWEEAITAGVRRFVICGSCFEYGRSAKRYDYIPPDAPLEPVNAYGASKAAASVAAVGLAHEKQFSLALLRPFHVFGEGQHPSNFWPSMRNAALAGHDFPMTAGKQMRDFTPVEDVARAFLDSVITKREPAVTIANLGTGQPRTLRDFAEEWWRYWKAPGKLRIGAIDYRPQEILRYVPSLVEYQST